MTNKHIHVVTGAFGYSGKYMAKRLLEKGHEVKTLTNSFQQQHPFGNSVKVHPLSFDRPETLIESLKGASTLYNTYWVRFNHSLFTHGEAVKNTLVLFDSAKKAGVKRIVHVSITNPSLISDLEYFRGKAELEQALVNSGMSYAILRPAVIFGKEDILINNIAWMLRKFPVFGVFGDGSYGIQPIYVDDFAGLAIALGESSENTIVDAIGPETFTYRELVEEISRIINKKRPIICLPPFLGYITARAVGMAVGDVVLTREEIKGLMAGLLAVNSPPAGNTSLLGWARQHAETLGKYYSNELVRRKNRIHHYQTG